MSYNIVFDKEQNTLFETDNEKFNKDIKNIKKFIRNFNDRYNDNILLLYPNFNKVKQFEDIYNIKNLHIFFVFQSRSHSEKYYFRRLTKNFQNIRKTAITTYNFDEYPRIIDNVRLHQVIAMNYCDKDKCKEYIEARLNKTGRLTNIDIDHIDGDRSNNNPSNLQIITHYDNLKKRKSRNVQTNIIKISDKKELKPITKINDDELKYTYYWYNGKVYRELTGSKRDNEFKEIIGKLGNNGEIYYRLWKKDINSQAIKTLDEIKKIINNQQQETEEEKEKETEEETENNE